MENRSYTNEASTYTTPIATQEQSDQSNRILIGVVVGVIILLGLLGTGVYFLLQPSTDTARIRDIFIIFMALESLLIGLALVILLIQLARLINLLQNEVKPILESTNETVSNLRGTTTFLSENLVEPVIKLNQYLAALTQTFKIIGLTRNKNKQ